MQPDFLHKPIPGISLTGEPGNAPWEQPPKMVKLDEVIDYYSDKITEPEVIEPLVDAIQRNIPLLTIAEGMLKVGVMEGMHSIDVGMLTKPVLVELMIAIAEIYGIKYVIDAGDISSQRVVPMKTIEKVVTQTVEQIGETKEARSGIVARRNK